MTIVVVGLTNDDKRPGTYTQTLYGQGSRSAGAIPRKLLLLGNKTAGGSRTANTGPYQVISDDDATAQFGIGSELSVMCYAALTIPGVEVWALPVTEAVGGVAATMTFTIAGAWTTSGQLSVQVGRWVYQFAAGTTIEATADNFVASVNSNGKAQWTATKGAGPGFVVTLTQRNAGTRGNYTYAKSDMTLAPAGMTLAIAGGAAHGAITPFGAVAGAGADDITTALTLIGDVQYDKIVPAQNDAVNLALLKAFLATQAGATIGHLDVVVLGSNGTVAAITSLANTTLNDYCVQLLGGPYVLSSPIEWSAEFAALRTVTEAVTPNVSYDKVALATAAPQEKADILLHASVKSLLNNGVTPLNTVGASVIVERSISTHCLDGAAPDYRNLDTSDTAVPIRVTEELRVLADARREANPVCGPDYPEGENPPGDYDSPALFAAAVTAAMRDFEKDLWITQVDDHLPEAEWNNAAKRIMAAVPMVVCPLNHQTGISVAQVAM